MIVNKLILTTLVALIPAFASALFINPARAAEIVANEIQMPCTQPNEVGNKSPATGSQFAA